MALPPFHHLGPNGDLYTLAVVPGCYLNGTSGYEPAHYVLRWSPSPTESVFSLGSVANDSRELSYHRLPADLCTPEFALLRAAACEGIPAHCWRLHSPLEPPEGEFAEVGHRAGYLAARHRLCLALRYIRSRVGLGAGSESLVLFRPHDPTGAGVPPTIAPDYEELCRVSLAQARERHRA